MWNTRPPHIALRTRGLTLVEMLMATALTLIMFAAVAQIFGMMGTAMRDARATIELSGNLRSVSTNLQRDLDNVSIDVQPWVRPGANQGYFEIIEGPDRDVDFAASDVDGLTAGDQGSMAGDADDVICFTAYSKDQPFVGLIYGDLEPFTSAAHPHKFWIDNTTGNFTTITSHYAEIVYFTKHTDADDQNLLSGTDDNQRNADETVTLYRRVFLIRPDIFVGDPTVDAATASYELSYAEAMNYYDLSMWADDDEMWQTNSLEDLQQRYRRVAHAPYLVNADGGLEVETGVNLQVYSPTGTAFDPAPLRPHALLSFEQLNRALEIDGGNLRDRTGEDVILTNTLAFDVRVFDPYAEVGNYVDSGVHTLSVTPGDPGYAGADFSEEMYGAFVDLNWDRTSVTGTDVYNQSFQNYPNSKSLLSNISIYGANSDAIFGGTTPTAANLNSDYFPQNPSMLSAANVNYAYYDTWPFFYESDGADQDGDGDIDEGTNGFDDDGDEIVDDHISTDFNNNNVINGMQEPSELETQPPYNRALRAVSITVRAIETGTRQVRQDTIVADFLPE